MKMKTINFSQTEFAKWFFEQAQTIEHYPFDAFYDCNHIVQRMHQTFKENKQYETPENNCVKMFFAVSYVGTHIYDINDENRSAIKFVVQNKYEGHRFYVLNFFYNYTYNYNQPFVVVDECTSDEIEAIFI